MNDDDSDDDNQYDDDDDRLTLFSLLSIMPLVIHQYRFNFPDGVVELFAEKVASRGLCAQAQAESLK